MPLGANFFFSFSCSTSLPFPFSLQELILFLWFFDIGIYKCLKARTFYGEYYDIDRLVIFFVIFFIVN